MNINRFLFSFSLFFILNITNLFGQFVVNGRILFPNGEEAVGVSVKLMKSKKNAITAINGDFSVNSTYPSDTLIVQYIGYFSDTIVVTKAMMPLSISLQESSVELGVVTINERRAATMKSRIELLQTDKIGADELIRAACCNLSESFETNPSVDVSYSDAATGAKQIKLLGLSGAYVQMLTENVPSLRGAAAVYGLDYIPATWLESIQVSKGSASVKNGYESITGQINMEFKKPKESDPLSLSLFAAHTGRVELNADAAIIFNPFLSTGIFVHYSQDKQSHDENGDGFTDIPLLEQANFLNRWFYKNGNYISQFAWRYLNETRENGQIHHIGDDLTMGPMARPLYRIAIQTQLIEYFTKNGLIINPSTNSSFALITAGSYHKQDSKYGAITFDITQSNIYLSLMYETNLATNQRLSTGMSLNFDQLSQNYISADSRPFFNLFPYRKEFTWGGYVEYSISPTDKLTILAGLRADHHNQYGTFVTPRLHLKYDPIEAIQIRASIGKGYRSVNPMAENSFLFASNRARNIKIHNNLKMEAAVNYGGSITTFIPIAEKELTLSTEYYHTSFEQQVVVDVMTNPNGVSFYNLDGKSYATNIQVEMSYPLFRGFNIRAAMRWTDAKTTYNGILLNKPLTNEYKGLITTSYQTPLKKWQFDATVQFNGGGTMPTSSIIDPLWGERFDPFTIMGAQATKFFRTWSIYLGVENILDFKQPNPIIDSINPFGENFDATMVWGPIHGRKVYGGIRWNLPKQ